MKIMITVESEIGDLAVSDEVSERVTRWSASGSKLDGNSLAMIESVLDDLTGRVKRAYGIDGIERGATEDE